MHNKQPLNRNPRRVRHAFYLEHPDMKKDLVLLVNADAGTEATVRTATAANGQVLLVAKSAAEAFVIAATEIRRLALVILDLDSAAAYGARACANTKHRADRRSQSSGIRIRYEAPSCGLRCETD